MTFRDASFKNLATPTAAGGCPAVSPGAGQPARIGGPKPACRLLNLPDMRVPFYRRIGRLLCPLLLSGAAWSAAANEPPVITAQTGDLTVYDGDAVAVAVNATGTPPLAYRWTLDGTVLPDQTTSQVVYDRVTTNEAGVYQVVVSNAYGTATNQPVTLTVQPNVPRLRTDLQDQTVIEGATTAIGVDALGQTPLYYYWYKNGTNLTGVFSTSLIFSPVTSTNAGTYQVVVSNALGTATSRLATLTVKPNTPRQLRTSGLGTAEPGRVVAGVTFAAQGDENALGFSFSFNPAQLANPVTVVPPDTQTALPGANFHFDETASAEGRLGVLVTLPAGHTMPTQTLHLVNFQFDALGTNWAQSGLGFGSVPVALGATNTTNGTLPVLDIVSPVLVPGPFADRPDRQTGLFRQHLTLVNPGALKIDGLDVFVRGLTNDSLGKPIKLYTASGSSNGVPFVYYGPLLPGATATLTLEYYVADRHTLPTPDYQAVIVPTRSYVASGGLVFSITGGRYTNGVFILDFQTFAGREYFIQYVDSVNSTAWKTAVPGVIGTGGRVQWVDTGPPRTASPPGGQTNRFYRGMLMP